MLARSTAWALALLIGVAASAQTGDQGKPSDSQKGGPAHQGGAAQDSGKTETICGEVTGVSVVGETMVDYDTGRGVVAEMTYLTILGSPSGDQKGSARGRDSGFAKSDGSRGADRPPARRAGEGSTATASDRRNVYLIAVSQNTNVCRKESHGHDSTAGHNGDGGQKDSGVQRTGGGASSNQPSQAALMSLELGDRVDVEFTRIGKAQDQAGQGGQGDSTNRYRHGRNRVVRGVAKSIEIVADPGHGASGEGKGEGASSEKQKSSSDKQGASSDKQGAGSGSGGSETKRDK